VVVTKSKIESADGLQVRYNTNYFITSKMTTLHTTYTAEQIGGALQLLTDLFEDFNCHIIGLPLSKLIECDETRPMLYGDIGTLSWIAAFARQHGAVLYDVTTQLESGMAHLASTDDSSDEDSSDDEDPSSDSA
jgi:hypothetical protein